MFVSNSNGNGVYSLFFFRFDPMGFITMKNMKGTTRIQSSEYPNIQGAIFLFTWRIIPVSK